MVLPSQLVSLGFSQDMEVGWQRLRRLLQFTNLVISYTNYLREQNGKTNEINVVFFIQVVLDSHELEYGNCECF